MTGNARLTDLPPEILLGIFRSCHDTASVTSLMETCSVTYQVYKAHCQDILSSFAHRLLGDIPGIGVDAETCALAADLDLKIPENEAIESLTKFYEQYKIKRAEHISPLQNFQQISHTFFWKDVTEDTYETRNLEHTSCPRNLSMRMLRKMESLHPVIHECVQHYLDFTLHRSISSASEEEAAIRRQVLSAVETRRIYRAFYRFEIYRRLYGREFSSHHDMESRVRLWLSVYPPHEVEEVVSVADFLCERWILLSEQRLEYDPGDRPVLEWLMAQGLLFYLQTSKSEPETRRQIIKESRDKGHDMFLLSALRSFTFFRQRLGLSFKDDGFPERNTKLTLKRDHPDSPNEAWISSVFGRFEYENYAWDAYRDHRLMGYVMWDKERLASWSEYEEDFSLDPGLDDDHPVVRFYE